MTPDAFMAALRELLGCRPETDLEWVLHRARQVVSASRDLDDLLPLVLAVTSPSTPGATDLQRLREVGRRVDLRAG